MIIIIDRIGVCCNILMAFCIDNVTETK